MQRLRYLGLAVGITFALLLALWVAPLVTSGVSNTIKVGQNGDPPYNTNTGAALQAAINAANPGDTILVRGGNTPFTTTQPITITKSLIIRGGYNSGFTARDSGYTILEAAGPALRNQSVVFIGSQTIAGCPPTLAIESSTFLPPVSPTALAVTFDGFTLRYGDNGVRVCAPAEARIDLIGLEVTENYAAAFNLASPFTPTLPGGGIYAYLDNRATLVISATDINLNRATDGGGLYVANSLGFTTALGLVDDRLSPRLILDDLTINENQAVTGGGAVIALNNFSDIQLDDVDIGSNAAYSTAGGLKLDAAMHAALDMHNVSFELNQSLYGSGAGEIYLADNVTAHMENTIVQENGSTWGMSGLAIDTANNVQITGDKIVASGNTGSGPAVTFDIDNGTSLWVTEGITLTSNTATNVNLEDYSDEDGSAGAVFYVDDNSHVDLASLYAEDNLCYACDGGAAAIDVSGTSSFSLQNVTALTNTAIYSYAGGLGYGGEGGALYIDVGYDTFLTIDGGRFEHNQAICSTDVDAAEECADENEGRGGGMYLYGYTETPKYDIRNLTFYSNTAESYGGGLYRYSEDYDGTIRMEDNEFIENAAGEYGGGLYVDGPFGNMCGEGVYFNRNIFEGNVANSGGGAYLDDTFAAYCPTAEFTNNVFRENNALSGYGGGAYFDYLTYYGVNLLFSSNVFTSNVASGYGGGMYVDEYMTYYGGDIEFIDNVFTDNSTGQSGGGLAVYYAGIYYGGRINMERNTFSRNVSLGTWGGGGLYFGDYGLMTDAGGAFNFVDNKVEENTSAGDGAGISIYGYLTYDGSVNFSSNIISRNAITGTDGYGGGFYAGYGLEGGYGIFNNNIITENVATADGGGFYIGGDSNYGGQGEFVGNTLTDNVAGGSGGGCYLDAFNEGASFAFLDNTVSNNVAGDDGAGCYFDNIADGAQVYIGDSEFRNNQATYDGGALYIGSLGTFKAGALETEVDGSGALVNIFGNEMVGNRAGYSGTLPSGEQTGGNGGGILIGEGGLFSGGTGSHAINIDDNLIAENHAYSGSLQTATSFDATVSVISGIGGGIAVESPNAPTAIGSAGLDVVPSPTTQLTLRDNIIRDNVADTGVAGVGVSMSLGRLTAEGNKIVNNQTPGVGGGLTFESVPYGFSPLSAQANSNVEAVVVSNVITGNQASNGGSLWLYNNTITNTTEMYAYTLNNLVAQNSDGIIVQNFPYYSRNDTITENGRHGLTILTTITSTGSADVLNSIIWHNGGTEILKDIATVLRINYTTIDDGGDYNTPPDQGNDDYDPKFVDATAGDFHLQAGSPVSNTAYAGPDNTYVPDVDLDGLFRPVGAGYDRGAYEWRIADVDVEASSQSPVEAPGAAASIRMTVTNLSNYTDDFLVRLVSNSLGWPVNFQIAATAENEYIVTLAPNASAAFMVDVTVPAGTAAGAQTDLHFAVESQRDPYLVDSIQLDVTAADVAGVALAPNNSSQAAADSVVVYAHTLTNNGNFEDSIALSAASSKGWSVVVAPVLAKLAPGDSTTVHVSVTVPAGAGGSIDTTTVTATSSSPLGGSIATATDTTAIPHLAGISFSPGTAKQTIPGETITFTHQITNTGNGPDTFNFAFASVNGWPINGPAAVTLPAGATQSINVGVSVPPGYYDGTDVLYIQAASAANGAVTAFVQDTTIVRKPDWMPIAGVIVSPGTAKSAIPSSTVMYTHYVTNTGTAIDLFTLTYASSNGWAVGGPENVGLEPGKGQLIQIVVTIPADGAGKTDVMSVKATSTVNPVFSMVGQDTTVVSQPGVLLSPGAALNAMPGDTVRYTHQITNTGIGADTFVVSYHSEHGWSVSGPASVPLAPGASTEIVVDVLVPPGSFNVNDVLTINAVSSVNSAISNFVQNTTVVATLSFELMNNNSGVLGPDGRIEYTHMLVNTGTAPDTYAIQYVSSAGWNVSGPANVSLNGGESQLITVAIEAPLDLPVGSSDVTMVTATSGLDNSMQMSVSDSTLNAATKTYLPHIENHESFIP